MVTAGWLPWAVAAAPNTRTASAAPQQTFFGEGHAAGSQVAAQVDAERTELGLVPLVGGNTDYGIAAGMLGSAAKFGEGYDPYRWRTEFAAVASFKRQEHQTIVPYQDYYLKLTVPELFSDRFRLTLRASFTRAQFLYYYGIGNASSDVVPSSGPGTKYFQYDRIYPIVRLEGLIRLSDVLYLDTAVSYTQNWITPYPGSKLEADLSSEDPTVRRLVHAAHRFGVPMARIGLIFDDRDNELIPSRGGYHEIRFEGVPRTYGDASFTYGRANFTARFYAPLWGSRLVLASRLVGDTLVGDPPVYELTELDNGAALGGEQSVRGVPAQRYAGKTKILGNVELRASLFPFRAFDNDFVFGTVAFFDTGRVFADNAPVRELDGRGVDMKYGVGGGIRLQWGRSFAIRADAAWSPDARPIGLYFNAGHIF